MADDYVHQVGQASNHMMKASVELMNQAYDARQRGDIAAANRLSEEARQHLKVADVLDQADAIYKKRNSL